MKQAEKRTIREELDAIASKNNGILRGIDVVRFAKKNKRSALHKNFQWDDSKAAHQYRLWQARKLINIHFVVIKDDTPAVRQWVSLIDDRAEKDGGYRRIDFVMSNDEQRTALVQEALREATRWRAKWKDLHELAEIFRSIDGAEEVYQS